MYCLTSSSPLKMSSPSSTESLLVSSSYCSGSSGFPSTSVLLHSSVSPVDRVRSAPLRSRSLSVRKIVAPWNGFPQLELSPSRAPRPSQLLCWMAPAILGSASFWAKVKKALAPTLMCLRSCRRTRIGCRLSPLLTSGVEKKTERNRSVRASWFRLRAISSGLKRSPCLKVK